MYTPPGTPAKSPRQANPPEEKPDELNTQEEELLRFLLKYCKVPLFEQEPPEGGTPEIITVGQFILSQLFEDDLVSDKPVFKTIIMETAEKMDDPDFQPERYFVYHPDPEVSQMASSLLAEKWVESKRWTKAGAFTEKESDVLDWLIPRIFYEFKLAKIKDKHLWLEEQIGALKQEGDDRCSTCWQKSRT